MPKFLNEHQVGFDTTLIGFPNLGDCLAVVLQNEGGLFGFHITPGNARQSGEFARFIQNSVNLGPNSTHLYGSCYRPNRYNKTPAEQWREEMIEIADAIGYRGPISGFDTSKGTNIKRNACGQTRRARHLCLRGMTWSAAAAHGGTGAAAAC